jgi:hypothetical protein
MGLLNKRLQQEEEQIVHTIFSVLDREDVDGHFDKTSEKEQHFGFSFPLLINDSNNLFADDKVTIKIVHEFEYEIFYIDVDSKYRILLRHDVFNDLRFRYFNNKFQLKNRIPDDLRKRFTNLLDSFRAEEREFEGKSMAINAAEPLIQRYDGAGYDVADDEVADEQEYYQEAPQVEEYRGEDMPEIAQAEVMDERPQIMDDRPNRI